jgi:CHAT domain-containing protein
LFPKQIQPLIEDKNLTIIPDDVLLNIPFEALQTSNTDNDYLIYKHQISYANSITFLNQNNNQQTENTKNAVGIAPINFALGMSTLENSKTEVEQLNLFKDSKLLLEEKASKKQLIQNLDDYKVIHISTHASNDKFREPYLALSDSLININELYLTKNTADLVVLSACETANGELYKGEGVLSLSRSFFNTGAKSVASTLWSIDDKSTSEIMASFYQNLNNGQSKSEALHQAKLNYLNSHSLSETSPYYWASFVLVGDTSPIDFHEDYTVYYMAIGIVITAFLMFMLWKLRRKKAVH